MKDSQPDATHIEKPLILRQRNQDETSIGRQYTFSRFFIR